MKEKETLEWQFERHRAARMEYYRETYKDSYRLIDGLPPKNKNIVVYCEQGIGDTIQMLRYIPMLATDNKVTVHCVTPLHRLVRTLADVDTLEKFDDNIPEHDFHILSMDLPLVYKTILDDPYFKITETFSEVEDYSNRIGIAWEGNPDHPKNLIRSCPLKHFQPLPGQLFCLQNKIYLEELHEGCENMNLLSVPMTDLYDTAKLIASMDRVVSVDTAVAHLSGAMGKETYLLLGKDCDPRWGEEFDNTPWYPSMKIIRCRYWKEGLQGLANKLSI